MLSVLRSAGPSSGPTTRAFIGDNHHLQLQWYINVSRNVKLLCCSIVNQLQLLNDLQGQPHLRCVSEVQMKALRHESP